MMQIRRMQQVIITGAGRGIGKALCDWFLNRGDSVLAISRNVSALRPRQGLHIVQADVTQEQNWVETAEKCFPGQHEGCRIVIHNAGILVNRPFEAITKEEMEQMFAVNVFAPIRLTQQWMPWMRASGCSHTVFITSMGGFQGSSRYPGLSVYSSSKSALASLAESLAAEYADSGHHFNALALGAVDTEMLEEAFPGYKSGVSSRQMAEFIGQFASEGYRLMNGKVLPVSRSSP